MYDFNWASNKARQLFVTLYDNNNNLRNDGGVSRAHLYEAHELHNFGQRGGSTIWGFNPVGLTNVVRASPLAKIFMTGRKDESGRDLGFKDFWAAISALQTSGLMQFIPHVFESGGQEAEMLHAYPTRAGACEAWEESVAACAHAAASCCLAEGQRAQAAGAETPFVGRSCSHRARSAACRSQQAVTD